MAGEQYEIYEEGTAAALAGVQLALLNSKVDKTGGSYPAIAAGSATGITGDVETASWMARQTHADGAAVVESVRGNTLRWSQLVINGNFESASYWAGRESAITIADGVATITPTSDGLSRGIIQTYSAQEQTVRGGRKYYIAVTCKPSVAIGLRLSCSGVNPLIINNLTAGVWTRCAGFWTPAQDTQGRLYAVASAALTTADTLQFKDAILIDLTAMFGAGNEPATVAEFEALYPKPYYPYDPGSLLSVRMEGVETVAADESWSYQRTIPASTYFPDGMRSAGNVRDELTETQAITRVGERAYQSGDESDASVITDGTVTHYALATPTTTPIDPPLPLSYRTGAGGTERVMVPEGETSAPPIFVTRYPLDPADLAASIAPVDGPTAKTNHQVGDLLMLGFTLCKATQVIVTGETIAIGTNVTRTSVAAELAALS